MDRFEEIFRKHDNVVQSIWHRIPVPVRVAVSPILLPLYFSYCIIAIILFLIPWFLLDKIINSSRDDC